MIRVLWNAIVILTWTPWCATLVLVARLLTGSATLAYRLFRFWARSTCRLCGIEVRTTGSTPSDPDRPHVFVANHPTSIEPLLMLCVGDGPLASVAKKELLRIPLVGWVPWAVGWLFIDRGDPESSRRSIDAAAANDGLPADRKRRKDAS